MSALPELKTGQSWACGNGCGECKVKESLFEYSRTEHPNGDVESKSQLTFVSACCGAEVLLWDEGAQDFLIWSHAEHSVAEPVTTTLPAAPAPTEGDKFREHLQWASDEVATWPAWKQRVAAAPAPTEQATDFLMPEDAWNEYATRSGLLNEYGVAPDPAKTQTAYFAYIAAWNRLHAAFSAYITEKRHLISGAAARQAPTLAINGDAIAKSRHILNLVDDYEQVPNADNRTKLRMALMAEFEAVGQAHDSRDAARLDLVYRLAMVEPFIAPIATKEKWLASVDARLAKGKAQ